MLIKYSFEDLESHRAGINVELDKSPLQQLLEPLECTQSLSKLKTLRTRYQPLYPQAQKNSQASNHHGVKKTPSYPETSPTAKDAASAVIINYNVLRFHMV